MASRAAESPKVLSGARKTARFTPPLVKKADRVAVAKKATSRVRSTQQVSPRDLRR